MSQQLENRIKKIVLIDDEKSFVDLLSYILKKENYEVISFIEPSEVLKNINLLKDADLILLDLYMPNIDGFNLLSYLKKELNFNTPPIIFITNLKYTEDGQLIDDDFAKNLGVNGVIFKTDDYQKNLEKIKSFL
jgi:CheY-like chemotaxis protein